MRRAHIVLSERAESALLKLSGDLANGTIAVWDLPPSLVEFYYVAFFAGRESLSGELSQAQRDADRLYRVTYSPPVAPEPSNYRTFAQLEQLRAEMYAGTK